ncbi:hypothetical protein V1L52_00550 [Treponema sp. HNW]|uniref:hypothetical protein n=1 Tax=Treponema sp. HNW TaxID=3116654 RepID=UPI003D0AC3D5
MKKIAVISASIHHKITELLLYAAAENTDIEFSQVTKNISPVAYKAAAFLKTLTEAS